MPRRLAMCQVNLRASGSAPLPSTPSTEEPLLYLQVFASSERASDQLTSNTQSSNQSVLIESSFESALILASKSVLLLNQSQLLQVDVCTDVGTRLHCVGLFSVDL